MTKTKTPTVPHTLHVVRRSAKKWEAEVHLHETGKVLGTVTATTEKKLHDEAAKLVAKA